jgi:HD-GYP domain-containing protein (c-di-GMP phosphodiesterase class II)
MNEDDYRTLLDWVEKLNAIGARLATERNLDLLLEMILLAAKQITNADGGTLYTLSDDGRLKFETVMTDSLAFSLGGTSGRPIPFPPISLYHDDGKPNLQMVATYAALTGEVVAIEDAYAAEGFDFSGTRAFDARTGYRSRSFLTVPMRIQEGKVIGVLQLINAMDPVTGDIVPFSERDRQLTLSLASQASIALHNKKLLDDFRGLFDSIIRLVATAIDEKSLHTAGHCRRVPEITMHIAEAVSAAGEGPFAGVHLSDRDLYELKIAAWLHDCGKIITPEYVLDKSTKLETTFDRIELIDTRFEILRRDAEIARLREKVAALETEDARAADSPDAAEERDLTEDREFLRRCNSGEVRLSESDVERVEAIARRYTYISSRGERMNLLDREEVRHLTVRQGTLTEEERTLINSHIDITIRLLDSIPFPDHLRQVPEIAGSHHERMNGTGYPRKLRREQMSLQARILAIADVFEALTANDRPYKKGMTISMALEIMRQMKESGQIDPDLFELFCREKLYLPYARMYLAPYQQEG